MIQTVISRFLAELKRRHVIRVAFAYVVVGWAAVQVADTIADPLRLPEWSVALVIYLVVVGFPVAIVLAWGFDITDRGVERTSAATAAAAEPGSDDATDPTPARRSDDDAAPEPAGPDPNSVAALPFRNLSGDQSQEYFSDGVTEELINALSRQGGLRVAAHTSSFAFKDTRLDAREIGEKLGVATLLEGSVRVVGSHLRLSVQLVNALDGCAIWSESYERDMQDVFAVQREIASEIASRLGADGRPPTTPSHSEPREPEAYRLYLKGRFFWNRRTPPDLHRAIEHFERALELDPRFALAHVGLADAYAILLDYGLLSTREGLGPARRAAEEALRLDGSLAEAYTSLALTQQLEWEWRAAEASFVRSVERRPDYAVARQRYALFLAWTGRSDRALEQIEEARRIDPLSAVIGATVGWVLYYARSHDRAAEELGSALELDPHNPSARVALGLVALAQDRPEDAVAEHERALADSRGSAPMRALLAFSSARAGDSRTARSHIEELERAAENGFVSPYYLALAELGLGNVEAALDRLEQARDERAAQIVYLRVEPVLDPIRDHTRFQALLEETGLDRYQGFGVFPAVQGQGRPGPER